jgi:hypothetical protein
MAFRPAGGGNGWKVFTAPVSLVETVASGVRTPLGGMSRNIMGMINATAAFLGGGAALRLSLVSFVASSRLGAGGGHATIVETEGIEY